MESNRKNWRRRNISKSNKVKTFIRSIFLALGFSIILLWYINKRINVILGNYIDAEIDRISAVIVDKSLRRANEEDSYDFIIKKNEDDYIYNTKDINRFKDRINDIIFDEFKKLEEGNTDVIPQQKFLKEKYPFITNGYLCEVTLNSIRNSTILGNIGPSIPIKLSFIGYVESDVEAKVSEYGINNALVEIDIIVKVSNLISMPISTRVHHSTVKNTISLELIKGDIPSYYFK